MTVLTPAEFYTGGHIRTLFRAKGPMYSAFGHRGQDYAGWPAGTPIPAYKAGIVVNNRWSSALGWMLTLEYDDGRFGGFCHLQSQSPLALDESVAVGQIIGAVGSTGTAATGPHLHATLSSTSTDPGSGEVEDPLPYINACLTTVASLTAIPIHITSEEPEMPAASIVRNYATEIERGEVATALIYPDGTAVLLHATDDVDSAVIAHVQVYGLQPTTADPAKVTPRDRFGSQLNDAQWDAFWRFYPGTKIGF